MSLTGLAFMFSFLLGCVLALARWPIAGLVTYVAVFYLSPPDRWWGETLPDLRWSLTSAIVTLIAVLVHRREAQRFQARFWDSLTIGLVVFAAWLAIQYAWALNPDLQFELLALMAKYLLLVGLMRWCITSELNLRLFLWSHVLGCFYLGWLAYSSGLGGRFDYFGGPGIGEANAGALQLATGILAAAALFLEGKTRARAALLSVIPFIVNGLIMTISRSGFLAVAVGGVFFNLFTPHHLRRVVHVLSVLALTLFVMLTNPEYWMRIGTIREAGEQVENVDTGRGRVLLLQAQLEMAREYPLGCGHRCTVNLSGKYLPDAELTGEEGERGRASHNTFMTMLVEQGIPGAVLYVMLIIWMARRILAAARINWNEHMLLATIFPAVAGVLAAITVGDLFVDYLKMEVRFWFMTLITILPTLATQNARQQSTDRTSVERVTARPRS